MHWRFRTVEDGWQRLIRHPPRNNPDAGVQSDRQEPHASVFEDGLLCTVGDGSFGKLDDGETFIECFATRPSEDENSTVAFSNPDIGPQSKPSARAAMMKYTPGSVQFRLGRVRQVRVVRK